MKANIFTGKSKYFIFLSIIIISFFILHSNLKHITDQPPMTLAPWALSVATATAGSVSEGFPALGVVKSASEVRITPQIIGTILALGPRAGGHVNKGELLVQIDTQELEANRDALRAKLVSATAVEKNDSKELERELDLFKEDGSSESSVDKWRTKVREDRANVQALRKQIDQVEVKIGYGHIISPLSADIAQRPSEVGDTSNFGKILYVLTSEQGGRVIIPVPLETLTHVKPGGEVQFKRGIKTLTALITRVNPALDEMAMGSVEIDLLERVFNLPDGSPISVRVITNKIDHAVIIPQSAMVPSSNTKKRHVFKVTHSANGEQLIKLAVNVLLCGVEGCAIEGDIQVGTRVVIGHGSVLLKLKSGDAIDVIETTGSKL